VKVANDKDALARSLAAGEVRISKTRNTIADRVFGALSEGHFHGEKLTIKQIADKGHVHERAVPMAIWALRKLGFRINCDFFEHIEGAAEQNIYVYWFAAEGEEDKNFRRPQDGPSPEEIAETHSAAVEVLSLELEDERRRRVDAESESASRLSRIGELEEEVKRQQARASEANASVLLSKYKDDVLVDFAVTVAPLLDVHTEDFRGALYAKLRDIRRKS
jgi:hypothetical protein